MYAEGTVRALARNYIIMLIESIPPTPLRDGDCVCEAIALNKLMRSEDEVLLAVTRLQACVSDVRYWPDHVQIPTTRGAISDFHQGWPWPYPFLQSQKLKEKFTAFIYSTGVYTHSL